MCRAEDKSVQNINHNYSNNRYSAVVYPINSEQEHIIVIDSGGEISNDSYIYDYYKLRMFYLLTGCSIIGGLLIYSFTGGIINKM